MTRKIKIIILGDSNSIHLQKWVLGLKDEFDITVFSLDPLIADTSLINALKNVKIISNSERTTNVKGKLSYLKTFRLFKAAHNKIQPDIVHAHYATSYGLLGRLLKPKLFFISVWGSDVYEFPKKSVLNKIIFKWIIKSANRLFSTSHDMARELSYYTSKEIKVIPFGIDLATFKPQKPKQEHENIVVGTIKALENVYGVDRLINSFALFHREFPSSQCHIYGKGSEESNLKNLATRLGIQNEVKFMGMVNNREVPEVLASIDIFCVLSRRESFGVSAVEASACEIPVIATNVGGLPEVVINEVTGFIVAEDENEIAEKMIYLANNKLIRTQFGKAGRIHVQNNYNWKHNIETMIELYKSACLH